MRTLPQLVDIWRSHLPRSPGLAYLDGRGLARAAHLWHIGWAPAHPVETEWARTARLRNRLTIPAIATDGTVTAATGRHVGENGPPKYLTVRNRDTDLPVMFGEHLLPGRARRPVAICEGPLDAVALTAAGATALAPGGTHWTQHHTTRLLAHLHPGEVVLLAHDADPAGRAAAARTWHQLTEAGIPTRAVELPEGADPASVWADNPGLLSRAVGNPLPGWVPLVDHTITTWPTGTCEHVTGQVAVIRDVLRVLPRDQLAADAAGIATRIAERAGIGLSDTTRIICNTITTGSEEWDEHETGQAAAWLPSQSPSSSPALSR